VSEIYMKEGKITFIDENGIVAVLDGETKVPKIVTKKSEKFEVNAIAFDNLSISNFVMIRQEDFIYVNLKPKEKSRDGLKKIGQFTQKEAGLIVGADFCQNGDLVIVTQPWLNVLQELPEPFKFYNKVTRNFD
ncbi:WD domain containing protein, partial [Entamoeba invadens IP1]